MGLRRRGIDIVRPQEIGLADAADDVHLGYAFRNERVLVTQDAGFILRVENGEPNFGVAFCEQGTRSIGEMISALVLIYEVLTTEEMRGRIEYI